MSRTPVVWVGLLTTMALLSGCLGGNDADAFEGPTQTFTLVTGFDDDTGFYWHLEGDDTHNPVIRVPSGTALEFRAVHGSDAADAQPHNLRIMLDGEILADSETVTVAGDETTFTWVPEADGLYDYLCKFHGFTQGAKIVVGDVEYTEPEPEPEPEPLPPPPPPEPLAVTLVSQFDILAQDPTHLPALDMHWKAEGGDLDGQLDPTLEGRLGVPIQFTIRHGSDPGDLQGHVFYIAFGGTEVATASEVAASGDETTLEWTPTEPGAYTYGCKNQASMGGSISVGLTVITLESYYDSVEGMQWMSLDGDTAGEVNPTFTVSVNETVHFVYRHGSDFNDDMVHNLRIKDAAKNELIDGPDIAAAGDEASIEWTFLVPGTYIYECKYHLETQRGFIQVV